jgi:hypothetical protein
MNLNKIAKEFIKPSLDTIHKMKETVDNVQEISSLKKENKSLQQDIDKSYEKIGELWRKEYPIPLSERNTNKQNRAFDIFKK